MKGKCFIDTNIYVYLFDKSDKRKSETARELLKKLADESNAVISYQVIQEFCNLATGKFKTTFKPEDVDFFVRKLMYPFCEVFASFELFESAIEINQQYKYRFYDSLIISASLKSDCKYLISEDLRHGQSIGGIQIINPFLN